MITKAVFLAWILLICVDYCKASDEQGTTPPSKRFIYDNTLEYNKTYELSLNNSLEYILEFVNNDTSNLDIFFPSRICVTCTNGSKEYPLFITANQQKSILSWQLPMKIQTPYSTLTLHHMARTLCPKETSLKKQAIDSPTITLSTSSFENITTLIQIERVTDFYVGLNQPRFFSITPSEPQFYTYLFENKSMNALSGKDSPHLETSVRSYPNFFKFTKSVLLIIESDNKTCGVVSIQNNSCPVFDNEREILYEGYYLTMMEKGGITLTQDQFPNGFHIVFIVKESDSDCVGEKAARANKSIDLGWSWTENYEDFHLKPDSERVKHIRLTIVPTISYEEYAIAASLSLLFFGFFYFVALAVILFYARCSQSGGPALLEEVAIINADETFYTATEGTSSGRNGVETSDPFEGSDSDAASDYSNLSDRNVEKDVYRLPAKPKVADLAKKRSKVLTGKTNRYLWHLYTISVFYALPVIQLVITYQGMLNQTGNQDLCYYNFLCAHPLGFLSDFNHVYSNMGYVLLGILFILLVRRRERRHKNNPDRAGLGIPQHYGLFYSMGGALIMEGILSASYHVCPNKLNFQFDSSFMYVIAVICMVKIYQTRHPDINASAHSTFSVLALIIFIGLIGVLNANFAFWIIFTIVHLVTCFILTLRIYYMGRFKFGGVVKRAWLEVKRSKVAAVKPNYVPRMVLLLIANIANWMLAGFGMYNHKKDFAVHLLGILMGNTILYTLFYFVMKMVNREPIRRHTWFFFISTHIAWFSSLYFFLDAKTKWSLTPAQSRRYNQECELLEFYDSHDVWHFMSAIAMFLSFNLLLTMDDGLSRTPREEINVF